MVFLLFISSSTVCLLISLLRSFHFVASFMSFDSWHFYCFIFHCFWSLVYYVAFVLLCFVIFVSSRFHLLHLFLYYVTHIICCFVFFFSFLSLVFYCLSSCLIFTIKLTSGQKNPSTWDKKWCDFYHDVISNDR